ncbi:MAG: substrate-binding domain-containing protein [Acidiferrobacterales bacterium]|nr:substrate-binding domain-containing protein [Acidiferrobacterales bacterium]
MSLIEAKGNVVLKGLLTLIGSIAILITPVTTQAVAKQSLTWAGCGISKKAFMTEMAKAYEKKTGIKIELQGGGATKGIRKVAAREIDLGGACRQTLEDPNTLSSHTLERRVQMDPVAWDALAVIVHKGNPVGNITLDQLRKVYTGRITNWSQLGGNNAPIELYVRKGKISGVGRTSRELIFYDYDQEFSSPRLHVEKSTGPIEKAIEKDAVNGIAISGISSAKRRKVKLLKLEGHEPSYENIKNGSYLLYRPLFLVTHLRSLDNPEILKFSQFVHSEDGKQIMRNVGTVPYEDAIHLWLKYLGSVRKAQDAGLRQ